MYGLYINGYLYTYCTEEKYAYDIFQFMQTSKGDTVTCWHGPTLIFRAKRGRKTYKVFENGQAVAWLPPLTLQGENSCKD